MDVDLLVMMNMWSICDYIVVNVLYILWYMYLDCNVVEILYCAIYCAINSGK